MEIAVCEKNRARAAPAGERRFFAEMWAIAGDEGEEAGPAGSRLILQAVYPALPGADPAGGQDIVRLFDALTKFARFPE
jgi:hypothetical protein